MKRIAVFLSTLALVLGLVLPAAAHTVGWHCHFNSAIHTITTYTAHKSWEGMPRDNITEHDHWARDDVKSPWYFAGHITYSSSCGL